MVRTVRARRPQALVSRRLGFTTNVVYTWECGRCCPSAAQFLRLAELCGVDTRAALKSFYPRPPLWLDTIDEVASSRAIAAFLRDQRGSQTLVDLALRTGVSRFALSRWLKGSAEPRMVEFLLLLDTMTQRMLEWVRAFVDPRALPSLQARWRQHEAARAVAYEVPWAQAVLRALELADYARLREHRRGWLAKRLRIDLGEEERALAALSASGQIEWRAGKWHVLGAEAVSLWGHEAAQQQRAFWVKTAAERAGQVKGMYAYNVCSLSEADLKRLKALQRTYLQEVRNIVAASKSSERVALVQVQVLALDDFHD